jgi:hypothetical protein
MLKILTHSAGKNCQNNDQTILDNYYISSFNSVNGFSSLYTDIDLTFQTNIPPPPAPRQVEAADSSGIWVNFYQNTWHHIPEHGNACTYSKCNYSCSDMAVIQFRILNMGKPYKSLLKDLYNKCTMNKLKINAVITDIDLPCTFT